MRLLALDTETTGLHVKDESNTQYPYHRITEIAVVEIVDNVITGRKFQTYLNPEREVSKESYKITGLSNEFLKDKPLFKDVVEKFLEFIDGGKLIIHNAKFDIKFLNFELSRVEKRSLDISNTIDTLILARTKFPGQKASLDALCKKFNIDNSSRVFHGALMDAQLLAKVYLHMEGFSYQFRLDNKFFSSKEDMLKINRAEIENLYLLKSSIEEARLHNEMMKMLKGD